MASSGYSGLEVAGSIGALGASLAAIAGLFISISAGNAKRRRQYDDDLTAARAAGRAEVNADLAESNRRAEMYEKRYMDLMERLSGRDGAQ